MSGRTVYLDATAIGTLVLATAGSAELAASLRGTSGRATSALSRIEVQRAIALVEPDAMTRAEEVLARLATIAIDPPLVAAAVALRPPTLSVAGAIHVASASLLAESLDAFVTYDPVVAAAARSASLHVESPGIDLVEVRDAEIADDEAGPAVVDDARLMRVVDRLVGRLRPDRIIAPADGTWTGGALRLAMVPGPWSPGRGASWVAQEAIEDLDLRLDLVLVDEDAPEPAGRVLYQLP